ncbi:MAG: hypothetical protein JKY61_06705 [Planctomycetes bacterium]|nr:hypothetical protein [Planctomycetota bacterium]
MEFLSTKVLAFQWWPSDTAAGLFEACTERGIRSYENGEALDAAGIRFEPGDWLIFDDGNVSKIDGMAFDLILKVKLDYDPESDAYVEAEHEGNHYIIDTENQVIDVYSRDGVRMPKSVLPVFQIIADNELPSFDSLRVEFEDGVIDRRENDQSDHAQELRRAV